jgi:hypothetical protein
MPQARTRLQVAAIPHCSKRKPQQFGPSRIGRMCLHPCPRAHTKVRRCIPNFLKHGPLPLPLGRHRRGHKRWRFVRQSLGRRGNLPAAPEVVAGRVTVRPILPLTKADPSSTHSPPSTSSREPSSSGPCRVAVAPSPAAIPLHKTPAVNPSPRSPPLRHHATHTRQRRCPQYRVGRLRPQRVRIRHTVVSRITTQPDSCAKPLA